jgi:hypothetical protein
MYKQLFSKMHKYGDRGSIASLGGPSIEIHYKELEPLLRRRSSLLFAEMNKNLIQHENLVQRIQNLNDPRVDFYQGDIWDGINSYMKADGWYHKHVLFDLDFCCSAPTVIKAGLWNYLAKLAESKLPRKNGFWISLTFCRRADLGNEWMWVPSLVLKTFTVRGWQPSHAAILPYAEKRSGANGKVGSNMVTMQFRFKWDYLKSPVRAPVK